MNLKRITLTYGKDGELTLHVDLTIKEIKQEFDKAVINGDVKKAELYVDEMKRVCKQLRA